MMKAIKRKIETNRNKPSRAFLLCIVAFLTAAVVFLTMCSFFKPQQVVEYKMSLIVGNRSGFDINRTAITFGMVSPSGSSTKSFSIKNSENKNKVTIKATGDLAKWISASDNNFMLQPYEFRVIDLSATVPADAKPGNYTGTLRLNFLKRDNFILRN